MIEIINAFLFLVGKSVLEATREAYFIGIACGGVDWIQLPHDRVHWRDF
jgi:hypothetical protein